MIAISYRREDSTSVAGRLHDRLQADFGRKNVFMDFDSIPYGVDFREQIKQTLERARVVIAVIGPSWFGGRGKSNRRIDDPTDFVRLEIATALQRGIPVIPVLIDDTPMPQMENLPADLQGLAFRNALVLDTGVDFHHHADRLIAGIRDLVKDEVSGASALPENPAIVETESAQPLPIPVRKEDKAVVAASERRKKKLFIGAGALLVVIAAADAGWYAFARAGHSKNKPALSLAIATPVPVIAETPAMTPSATATIASTSTPAATPLVAVTPVAVPIPTLAPPPPPAPVNNMISDNEVRAFIFAHYQATERKDLDYLLGQYDDVVDYSTDGRRDKAFIRNGYVNYFKRWPITSFTLGDIGVVHSSVPNVVNVHFEVRYHVRDSASNRSKQGRADEEWVISKPFGDLKIISEKETVHGQAPERYRSRRY